MRESCKSGSVGAPGGQPPGATRQHLALARADGERGVYIEAVLVGGEPGLRARRERERVDAGEHALHGGAGARTERAQVGARGADERGERGGVEGEVGDGVGGEEVFRDGEAQDFVTHDGEQHSELGRCRRRERAEGERARRVFGEDAVEDDGVEVHVEVERGTEALDEGDGTGARGRETLLPSLREGLPP